MALVAYGSSGESDSEDEEATIITVNSASAAEDGKEKSAKLPAPAVTENFLNLPELANNKTSEFNISDDEDDLHQAQNGGSILDEAPEPDLFSLISKKLPNAKTAISSVDSFVDNEEDVSTIVKKTDYGTELEQPPTKKKKRDGPVKISIPSLSDLNSLQDEDERPVPRVTASKKGSGLFALLPDPKNKMSRRPISRTIPESCEDMIKEHVVKDNLKPTSARRVGLVPHIIANPVPKADSPPPSSKPSAGISAIVKPTPADDSDSDTEDFMGINSGSYFPEPEVPDIGARGLANPAPGGSSERIYGLKRPPLPPPRLPAQSDYVPLDVEQPELGPAVAPYPPTNSSYAPLPEAAHLDDQVAIERLAGKAAKRREFEDMQIIDVHEDQMRGDPNVWLTKAMTEEQAPAPNRKAGPKGLAKSRHQITYLAHQAKERDWELRQEWSQARANKRASMNKYGFC